MEIDIRMEVVDEKAAIDYLKSLNGMWIYIKNINDNFVNERIDEQIAIYTKFKVKNISEDSSTILIYGEEDNDRLVFDKKYVVSYQMTYKKDELYIQIKVGDNFTRIYIKKYLPTLMRRLNEILASERNLIITEGKTDWKHLKHALAVFQSQNLYKDINFDFFEYEDDLQMGNNKLMDILNYSKLFYSVGIKVFVFDSDDKEINKKHDGKSFVSWGNNVFSLILPVPQFRERTPLISIENYYTDEEIKTCDENERRLYINDEFDDETGVLKNNPRIFNTQYKKLKKNPPNHIIDDNVFLVPINIDICDDNIYKIIKECTNIALSKNNFAENISKSKKPFDSIKSDKFSLIFDVIREIQNHKVIKTAYEIKEQGVKEEVTISDEIFIKKYDNELQKLEIHLDETYDIQNFDGCHWVSVQKEKDKFNIILNENVTISLPLTPQIWQFLIEKIDNEQNRIEVYIHKNNDIKMFEILNDELAGFLIDRAIH